MSWIIPLLVQSSDDFWVNVFAGIPFVFFDFVIITLVLPITIQWWDERRWASTRKAAILRIIQHFSGIALLAEIFVREVSEVEPGDQKALRGLAETWLETLSESGEEVDIDLQTALPTLGPEFTEDMLNLHYSWRSIRGAIRTALKGFAEEGPSSSSYKYARERLYKGELDAFNQRLIFTLVKYVEDPLELKKGPVFYESQATEFEIGLVTLKVRWEGRDEEDDEALNDSVRLRYRRHLVSQPGGKSTKVRLALHRDLKSRWRGTSTAIIYTYDRYVETAKPIKGLRATTESIADEAFESIFGKILGNQ